MRSSSNNSRLAIALSIILGLSMLAWGCGGGDSSNDSGDADADSTPAPSAELAVATGLTAPNLDGVLSNSIESIHQYYDSLTEILPDGSVGPRLATEWEGNADGSEWTFTVREGVTFNDGTEMTPADVVYSYKKVLSTPESLTVGDLEPFLAPDGVTADGQVITFKLKEPSVIWPRTATQVNIVPEKAYEADPESFFSNPIGTGPFKAVEFEAERKMVGETWEGYWGEKPAFDKVTTDMITDETARLNALRSGAIAATTLSPVTLETAQSDTSLEVQSVPSNSVSYLGFNTEGTPFEDPNVREAVNLAIDREAIASSIFHDAAVPTGQLLSPITFGFVEGIEPDGFDAEKAKALLEASDYDGEEVTFTYFDGPLVPGGPQVAQAIQGYLQDAGMKVKLSAIDQGTFIDEWFARKFPGIFLFAFRPSSMDGDSVYGNLLHSTNYFTDPVMEKFYKAQVTSTDEAARLEAFRGLAETVQEKDWFVPLVVNGLVWAWNPEKVSLEPRGDGLIFPQNFKQPE